MSTSDQPGTPPLTRRRMREIRNTGSTPVVVPGDEAPAPEPPAPTVAPLPRAAAPAPIAPAPEAPGDLGASPLTRRQARAHERIRTASVPVIAPDLPPAHSTDAETDAPLPVEPHPGTASDDADVEKPADLDPPEAVAEDAPRSVTVNPALGSGLLFGETSAPAASLPPSFDELITRGPSSTGSVATPNALILSQGALNAPLVAPVTATGEVLVTGTFELPEGLGSVGHAHGTTDGKDLDVALIDGELPPASSPTPIAASAAISTVRNSGEEIIRPPAPEKGGRLMLTLIITAGVLALALAGVLVVALTTGRI